MAEPMTPDAIKTSLGELPGWEFADDEISKTFKFKDFKEALGFIVRVGLEAETVGHHPDLHNVWNTVTIKLNTHDAGGVVTERDIELAQHIEQVNWLSSD